MRQTWTRRVLSMKLGGGGGWGGGGATDRARFRHPQKPVVTSGHSFGVCETHEKIREEKITSA